MSVLITGGAGFIASHIADILIKNGVDVIIADNLNTGNKKNLNTKAKFYNIDICSPNIEKIFIEHNIEYICHHAAQASVSESTKNPLIDAASNILGTVNLLEIAKKYEVKKFIAASTAAVYGTPEYLPVDEKHPTNYISNYGLSKLTMEKYIELSKVNYIIFRYSNVYGPRQNAHGEAGVVSIFINKLTENQDVQIHGNGEQTRDFVFVEDIAKANLLAINSEVKNEIINISSCTQISINELYNILCNILNINKFANHTDPRNGDIKDSILSNKKASELLGWYTSTNFTKGLELTINPPFPF